MNSAGKIAAFLLLTGMAGCKHNVQTAPPPAAQAPVYTPTEIANKEPAPQLPPAKPLDVKPPGSDVAQQPPPPKLKRPSHRKPKPADSTQTQAAKDAPSPGAPQVQDASAGQPPDKSPIGQLSSSSDSGTLTHQKIQDLINTTESGLNGIKRTLTSDEQQTATQIRTFLTKAKKALDQDDLDGANTLVTKAKVLLDELTKG
jgi:hypothetical protein